MAEGVFVHHFITCKKLSQVDKIADCGINQSIHMLKMIKIKVIPTPTQNYMYVTYVSTIFKFCLYFLINGRYLCKTLNCTK